jgi:phosphoesterase RecJ-like protein
MDKTQLRKFKLALKKASKIVIVTHFNPDGDALGSSLGLSHLLQQLGKDSKVIVPNPYPDFLDWLPGSKNIVVFSENEKKTRSWIESADMLFALDFNSFGRLEKLGALLKDSPVTKVLIDHHQQPDDFADYSWHDVKATSTCELVFDFMSDTGNLRFLDKKIAACLYTGLMTDTGSFRYPGVNAKTHRVLAALLETGIKPMEIHSAVYDNYSYDRLKLVGYALSEKLKRVEGLPVAYFTLSEKELSRFNYSKGDTEGLVNYPFSIKGVEVSALLNEAPEYVKLSLRSKGKHDMNKLARTWFEGGGHVNAAGGKSRLSLEETEKRFIEAVKTLF